MVENYNEIESQNSDENIERFSNTIENLHQRKIKKRNHRPIRLEDYPLFKRNKVPTEKYSEILNSQKMASKYPDIRSFINDKNAYLYIEENSEVSIHPLIRNEGSQRLYPMIDDMVLTLTPLMTSIDEVGVPLEKMGKTAQLIFKQLFIILLAKSEMETKRPQDSYYGHTPMNHYYRSDLLEEFSYLLYGVASRSVHYNIDRLFLLEFVRIYLEHFYFAKNEKTYAYRQTTPFKNMRFEIADIKYTNDNEYRIFKRPILKVTYKDNKLGINKIFLYDSPRYGDRLENEDLRRY